MNERMVSASSGSTTSIISPKSPSTEGPESPPKRRSIFGVFKFPSFYRRRQKTSKQVNSRNWYTPCLT